MRRFARLRKWRDVSCAALIYLVTCVIGVGLSAEQELIGQAQSHMLLDRHGDYLGEVPGARERLGHWPIEGALPTKISAATIAIEDDEFYDHAGVKVSAIFRAAWQNVRNGRVISGASTLAMQVARMQRPKARTVSAKIREAVTALILVRRHGHENVLRHYLEIAPYGNRVHGARRAARLYFDKPVDDLSWYQAAFLAGLPQSPGRMNPYHARGRALAEKRAHRILERLYQSGVIEVGDYEIARGSALGIVAKKERKPEAMHAILYLSENLPKNAPSIVYTTVDLDIQRTVHRIVGKNLARIAYRDASNSAAVVIDTKSNAVLGYVGSADYFDEESRGAIDFLQKKRSPGSTLKPFIYGMGLDLGLYTAASELEDTPMDFITERGRSYLPRNIGRTFLGPMLFREALGNSRNIPALRVLARVGVEPTLRRLDAAGVDDVSYAPDAYGLGLALGNLHLTPMELAQVYLLLAGDGHAQTPHFFSGRAHPPGVEIFSDQSAGMIRHILDDPQARRPSFPAGSILDFEHAASIKTGTSQGYRDAWTVAFTDRLLVVVWVGNHDWRRMNRLGGYGGAAPGARAILDELHPQHLTHQKTKDRFAPPAAYEASTVCALSGHRATQHCPHSKVEYFAPGAAPAEGCRVHQPVGVDVRNGLLATAQCSARFVDNNVRLRLPPRYRRWAEAMHLEIAPTEVSPLCGPLPPEPVRVSIAEPRDRVKYLYDPDTPREYATIRLRADVTPREEDVVFVVDGEPIGKVGFPHELRWSLTPGRHTIEAVFARRSERSAPVRITVLD